MLRKSLIQFSVDGLGCVPSLLLVVEVMKIMAASFKRSHAGPVPALSPRLCSRPLSTHASARDSWTLTGKSGSVSYGETVPFSWLLVYTRFCLCPPRASYPYPSEGRQNEKHNQKTNQTDNMDHSLV